MRAMNFPRLARHGVVAVLTSSLLAVVGACSDSSNEACGNNGIKNGVCDQGTTCPSGTAWLNITSPADECPDTYLCCVPTTLGSAAGSGASTSTDAGTAG
jgi:hypothetical protein